MKLLVGLAWAATLLPGFTDAGWFGGHNAAPGCAFTISSTESFARPAGQLPDGQIRLNGSEPVSTFYIGADGGITDAKGSGCIVTSELRLQK